MQGDTAVISPPSNPIKANVIMMIASPVGLGSRQVFGPSMPLDGPLSYTEVAAARTPGVWSPRSAPVRCPREAGLLTAGPRQPLCGSSLSRCCLPAVPRSSRTDVFDGGGPW
ncbi:hypothetical protein SNE510_77060 [Streptomyces sp. NE5-10]|nr:hypothetical protein SNE510_77060 [Streptomyces sp. NE5-10]